MLSKTPTERVVNRIRPEISRRKLLQRSALITAGAIATRRSLWARTRDSYRNDHLRQGTWIRRRGRQRLQRHPIRRRHLEASFPAAIEARPMDRSPRCTLLWSAGSAADSRARRPLVILSRSMRQTQSTARTVFISMSGLQACATPGSAPSWSTSTAEPTRRAAATAGLRRRQPRPTRRRRCRHTEPPAQSLRLPLPRKVGRPRWQTSSPTAATSASSTSSSRSNGSGTTSPSSAATHSRGSSSASPAAEPSAPPSWQCPPQKVCFTASSP